MKRLLMFFSALALALTLCLPVQTKEGRAPELYACAALRGQGISLSARCAVLIEKQSRKTLFGVNERSRAAMASTTKIMTALIIISSHDPSEQFCIPAAAVGIEGSSAYLKEGETLSVLELLYGLLLNSGNDAAAALALFHSGSIEAFAAEMNEYAAVLGLEDTHFANPSGLSAKDHYTTALALAQLTAAALEKPLFSKIVSTKSIAFGEKYYVNHNRLLSTCAGCVGVKTGYTQEAGRCLVSAAERDGMTLIAVTLDDPADWSDHRAMYSFGFSTYELVTAATPNEFSAYLPLAGGKSAFTAASNTASLTLCLPRGSKLESTAALPPFVYAPIRRGDALAYITFTVNGEPTATLPLCAERDEPSKEFSLFDRLFK